MNDNDVAAELEVDARGMALEAQEKNIWLRRVREAAKSVHARAELASEPERRNTMLRKQRRQVLDVERELNEHKHLPA